MEQHVFHSDIHSAVIAIKSAIQQSRKKILLQANRDSLALYYAIGGYIS